MKARLTKLWSTLAESFWLVPAAMALSSLVLAACLVSLDRHLNLDGAAWVWSGGASGARSLLSTVASSMVTVAGTVFSITIAALTLASQQFGSRLLRNFTTDRGNQLVLGTFVATFLYCLMVLRTVRGEDEGHFVPNLSVSVAVLLACTGLGVLIYFIHHVSSSIQAENLIASIGQDLKSDLRRLIPPAPAAPGDTTDATPPGANPPNQVRARSSGYIQAIDRDGLVAIARDAGLVVRLRHQPGDFVTTRQPLLEIWTDAASLESDTADRLCRQIQLGRRRTPWQDPRYGIRQLTEIGARALSPGINDPFTALGCIDWMTDALEILASMPRPTGVSRDDDGTARLLETPVGFAELLALGFGPMRAYGADAALVSVHILDALARLAAEAAQAGPRQAIRDEGQATFHAAGQAALEDFDRARVAAAATRLEQALRHAPPPPEPN